LITKFLPKPIQTQKKAIKETEEIGKPEKDTMPGEHGKNNLKSMMNRLTSRSV
jgi:hypothetical protein